MKTITFTNCNNPFYFGNFGELKKDILEMGAKFIKRYHGDLFITYGQLEHFVDKTLLQKSGERAKVYLSVHENGSDFWKEGDELYEDLRNRCEEHEGAIFELDFVPSTVYNDEYILNYKITNME